MSDNISRRMSVPAEASLAPLSDHVFRLLVDSITDYGIIMLTPTGRIASWNSGAKDMTGYDAEDVIGQHFSVCYPNEAIAEGVPERRFQQVVKEGHSEDEGWRVRKDGSRFWAKVFFKTVYDEQGQVKGYSKVIRDLTERKQREEQLKQSEERFRLLVEGAADYAIFMLDKNGLIVSWNTGAQALKGYTAQEVIGTHFSRFYAAEALERGWPGHELRMAREQGRFEDEGWRIRKDGTRFWANVVITAIRGPGGDLRGFSKITRDLTARREQEEQLKQSEERFRLLVEGAKDYAIFMLDPEGTVISWNAGAERIKAYSAKEIIGQSFTRFYTREDLQAGKPARELQMAREQGSVRDTSWRVRKDGTLFMADVTITALNDSKGTLRGYAKITRDLTQEKRIETLETEGRRINEFVAMLAHELRNPLAPIRNAVDLMGMGSVSAARLEWCRNVIDRQTSHLSRLVDDLLDVSRITRDKIVLTREALDLTHLINRGVEASLPLIQARRHDLKLTLPKEALLVEGDMTRLVQVLSNLLNNAAKYTPVGGTINISAWANGPRVAIMVKDNGIGMPAHLIGKVFDLFQQGDRELARTEGGLGIGLTLVEKIVSLHGGSVEARSEGLGKGSAFTVWLPILPPMRHAAPGADTGVHLKPAGAARSRVLIVDDNQDAAETMVMLMEAMGNDAYAVHDGAAAAEAARQHKPDLVLLDIGLPGMNGYEVARQFRSADDLRYIRLVAVTGYGQQQDRMQAREAGFDDFMMKPVSLERLRELLDSLGKKDAA